MRGEWSGIHGVMVNGGFRLLGTLMRVDMPSEVVLGDPPRLMILQELRL